MVTIRDATDADLPALVEMGERLLAFSPYGMLVRPDATAIELGLRNFMVGGVLLVAEDTRGVVGMMAGSLSTLWFSPSTPVALELAWWVRETHRGGPAGIRLLEAFGAWASAKGAKLMFLADLVVEGRVQSAELLARLGFHMVERVHVKEVA